nr:hypothetical protein [Hyphomonas sp. Mor2]
MKKAIIIIAVSKYEGSLPDLPGVITSACDLSDWASSSGEGYRQLVILDAEPHANFKQSHIVQPKITSDFLREKIPTFLNEDLTDRLVVYFAGHGFVRSLGSQFWLLSGAENDRREGIDVEGFRRGLQRFGFGAQNTMMSRGQISIISDACRSVSPDGLDFVGDHIVTGADDFEPCYVDVFRSSISGERSYQVDGDSEGPAFCIFSSVFIDALHGAGGKTVQNHHQFSPAVTSGQISEYLLREVPKTAREFGVEMRPDPMPGFVPPLDYYKRLKGKGALADQSNSKDRFLARLPRKKQKAVKMDWPGPGKSEDRGPDQSPADRLRHRYEDWLSAIPTDRSFARKREITFYTDSYPEEICAPAKSNIRVTAENSRERLFKVTVSGRKVDSAMTTVFVKVDDRYYGVPNYFGKTALFSSLYPGDVFLATEWDIEGDVSDYENEFHESSQTLSAVNAVADRIRSSKHVNPFNSVLAGYLYEFSNDYDNIARTSHYMAEFGLMPAMFPAQVNKLFFGVLCILSLLAPGIALWTMYEQPTLSHAVSLLFSFAPLAFSLFFFRNFMRAEDLTYLPIDLAVLCAERITWKKTKRGLVAFADLPAVKKVHPSKNDAPSERPEYTRSGFRRRKMVRCVGTVPVFSQGWKFANQTKLDAPVPFLKAAARIRGRSLAELPIEVIDSLLEKMDLVKHSEFDPINPE